MHLRTIDTFCALGYYKVGGCMKPDMLVKRVQDIGSRDATLLENAKVRVLINDSGGMVPELSQTCQNGRINAHWRPYFRSNSGIPYNAAEHEPYWQVPLLYDLAGSFPCAPNFGGPCSAYGEDIPIHGHTANSSWLAESWGVLEEQGIYLKSTLNPQSSGSTLPFTYSKFDVLLPDQPVHYSAFCIRNTGADEMQFTMGWHNTLGAPFLAKGSILDLSADRFATSPSPSEFDDSGRLKGNAEFDSLKSAPLADGGTTDLRYVPGMVGYTDLLIGAFAPDRRLAWSSVVNPFLGSAYLTFFRGPADVREGEFTLNFNVLWMQYGGRKFPPWATYEGGTDQVFCLGTENATGAFANGLEYARKQGTLLGSPTVVTLEAGAEKTLYYASAFFAYSDDLLSEGISAIERDKKGCICIPKSGRGRFSIPADPDFSKIETLVKQIG